MRPCTVLLEIEIVRVDFIKFRGEKVSQHRFIALAIDGNGNILGGYSYIS